MLKSDNLALVLAILWIFLYESFGSPYFGFYILPAIFSLLLFFYSPLISRELNAVLVFVAGIVSMGIINMSLFFLSPPISVPFFLILSSILYVFAKK